MYTFNCCLAYACMSCFLVCTHILHTLHYVIKWNIGFATGKTKPLNSNTHHLNTDNGIQSKIVRIWELGNQWLKVSVVPSAMFYSIIPAGLTKNTRINVLYNCNLDFEGKN